MRNIPLFKVFIPPTIMEPLKETLFSGLITQGPKVELFEQKLKGFLGYQHILTTNTATSALHLALRLNNIGPGDEVISSPLTCTATNWPVVLSGADLVWADVQLDTCNIDPKEVKKNITEKTKAILFVHWGGYPCDLNELYQIGKTYNLPIIEDCAHSFGSKYNGSNIGSFGTYCAFSFQAIKHLTTADGGCISVPSYQYDRAKLLRWYGISREQKNKRDFRCEEDISEVGDKLHMNDLNATIGIEQMNYVDGIIKAHQDNARWYTSNLGSLNGITLQRSEQEGAYWLYTIRVEKRDAFIQHMKSKGIVVSQVHKRNDKHSAVSNYQKDLPNVDVLSDSMVCIPTGWWVSQEDREYIKDCIQEGWV